MAGNSNSGSDDANSNDDTDDSTSDNGETFDADKAKAKISKVNSEAANLRRRVRELEAAEAKLKEIQDADKTEGQKALDEAAAAKARADKAEAELMRLTVAMDKGLSPAQAKRLVGNTIEELEADADDLVEQFGIRKPQEGSDDDDRSTRRPDRPKPATLTGPAGEDDDSTFDAAKVAARVRSRRNPI